MFCVVDIEDLEYPGDGLYYFNGMPFTGLAVTTDAGRVEAEEHYRDGLLWGMKKVWHRNGQLEREAECAFGVFHGLVRTWFADGKPESESIYEHGVLVLQQRWDEAGNASAYRLREGDPNYELVKAYRRAFGDNAAANARDETPKSADQQNSK